MKKLILALIAVVSMQISYGQQNEDLDNCNCRDQIDQINPVLNGVFERECNEVIIEKGEFIKGVKNGEWITYSLQGKLIRKINYQNGILDGKIELFYLNGKPKVSGQFEQGKKIGKWIYFTEKGKVLLEGSYEANIPIGIWTINDKKGKKTVVQYDYNSKKYLINNSTPFHKDGDLLQNANSEEWYIYKSPELSFTSKTQPLGGYGFANYMFVELMEVPVNYWDTYVYQKYKVSYKVSNENEMTFESELFLEKLPDNNLDLTFLIITNPTPKIKRIEHSNLQLKLLDYKITEALSIMPPWVFNEQSVIEVYLHYVLNENLHK